MILLSLLVSLHLSKKRNARKILVIIFNVYFYQAFGNAIFPSSGLKNKECTKNYHQEGKMTRQRNVEIQELVEYIKNDTNQLKGKYTKARKLK